MSCRVSRPASKVVGSESCEDSFAGKSDSWSASKIASTEAGHHVQRNYEAVDVWRNGGPLVNLLLEIPSEVQLGDPES